jgi:hypothetical protein
VARYLATTLENSRQSRRHFFRRLRKLQARPGGGIAALPGYLSAGGPGGGYISAGGGGYGSAMTSDMGSDGWPGVAALKQKGADGIRHMYERFARLPALAPDGAAPALHAYLRAQDGAV